MESFFLELHGLNWASRSALLLKPNDDPHQGPQRLAHMTASEYVKHGHISPESFKSFFKFGFVRNPWARLVSEYNYRNLDSRISFEKFIKTRMKLTDRFSDHERHLMPQSDYLFAEDGHCLVDFVGKFEQLRTDFAVVCERLGLDKKELPKRNTSGKKKLQSSAPEVNAAAVHKHYSEYFTEETRDLVGQFYAADIQNFGYTFTPNTH